MTESPKKVTIIILGVLSIALLLTIILVNNKTNFFSKASAGDVPKNIKISNITEDSLTISYLTDGRVIGTVLFGIDDKDLDSISLDDRDQLNQDPSPYNIHSITLRGLEPDTNYFFSINSGSKNYLSSNKHFTAKTGSRISKNPPAQIPAAGSVTLKNSTSPSEGIIYLNIDGSQLISAVIKNGNYIIPLNNIRNINTNDYFIISLGSKINIEAFSPNQGGSITINSNNLSPVSNLSLRENYSTSPSEHTPTVNKPKISNTPSEKPKEKSSLIDNLNIFKFFKSAQ